MTTKKQDNTVIQLPRLSLPDLTPFEQAELVHLMRYYSITRSVFRDGTDQRETDLKDYYMAIPNYDDVIIRLARIKKGFPNHTQFLDIGCGMGNVLAVASTLKYNAFGIECRQKYAGILSRMCLSYVITDAFEFKEYDKHDILYMYVPINETTLMSKLMNLVVDKMKIGSILMSYGGPSLSRFTNMTLLDDNTCYMKTSTKTSNLSKKKRLGVQYALILALLILFTSSCSPTYKLHHRHVKSKYHKEAYNGLNGGVRCVWKK